MAPDPFRVIVTSAITVQRKNVPKACLCAPPQKFMFMPLLAILILSQNLANYFYYFVLQAYKVFVCEILHLARCICRHKSALPTFL